MLLLMKYYFFAVYRIITIYFSFCLSVLNNNYYVNVPQTQLKLFISLFFKSVHITVSEKSFN